MPIFFLPFIHRHDTIEKNEVNDMQHQLSNGSLLDENGNLYEAGYATSLVKTYHRQQIKAPKWRIKEWDYYFVGTQAYGIALTIADNGYMGFISVTFFDFINVFEHTKSIMTGFPMGKMNLPTTSKEGNVTFKNEKIQIEFQNDGQTRHLLCQVPSFYNKAPLSVNLTLTNEGRDSMVIATPFIKPKHFYYNQKINCLDASGLIQLGTTTYDLDHGLGVLDWGRGVWIYKNTWYWSSLSARVDGHTIGFNLGYGFGDTSKATENMLFLDGIAYKIDQVQFHIPKNADQEDDYMSVWKFTSNDKSLALTFKPCLDRYSNTSLGIIASNQHQVFGYFSGQLRFGERIIEIKDQLGFAEKVYNKW